MGFSAVIVDDSKVVLRSVKEVISRDERFGQVHLAENVQEAKQTIIREQPDLVILDIGLPDLDGLEFLKIIMARKPLPVVIHSAMAGEGSANASLALEYGAVDVIEKINARGQSSVSLPDFCDRMAAAAMARVRRKTGNRPSAFNPFHASPEIPNPEILILIGASTGGPKALQTILQDLPTNLPPICITQHMPASMTGVMAARLDSYTRAKVLEARNGERLRTGHVYISPGCGHMLVEWSSDGHYIARIADGKRINNQCPSVDALFLSAAESPHAKRCIAILMTGMGDDGAAGLSMLKNQGAFTAVQSASTCTIASMPRAAMRLNAHRGIWDVGAINTNLRKAVFASVHWYQHS